NPHAGATRAALHATLGALRESAMALDARPDHGHLGGPGARRSRSRIGMSLANVRLITPLERKSDVEAQARKDHHPDASNQDDDSDGAYAAYDAGPLSYRATAVDEVRRARPLGRLLRNGS